MPYHGRQEKLKSRTETILAMAVRGDYHYDIARSLQVSDSTVQQTMKVLRSEGKIRSMRGPRKSVAKVDWDGACLVWFDPVFSMEAAVERIGCSERSVYRKLGPRSRYAAPVIQPVSTARPKPIVQPVPTARPKPIVQPVPTIQPKSVIQPAPALQSKSVIQSAREALLGPDPMVALRVAQAARYSVGSLTPILSDRAGVNRT